MLEMCRNRRFELSTSAMSSAAPITSTTTSIKRETVDALTHALKDLKSSTRVFQDLIISHVQVVKSAERIEASYCI